MSCATWCGGSSRARPSGGSPISPSRPAPRPTPTWTRRSIHRPATATRSPRRTARPGSPPCSPRAPFRCPDPRAHMTTPLRNDRGIALPVVLLMTLMVVGLATTALMMTTNGRLMRKANERIRQADLAALSGLEEARSKINGTPSTYPDTGGYRTIENGVTVTDASGTVIPGARRWTYVGPAGVSTGQYGVFGAIITKTTIGNVTSVRRRDINQETFAKFAYFTNDEGPGICFGSGDQIQGPVHSNDQICINSGGATFTGKLTTAASSISGQNYGTFSGGYTLNAAAITMPTVTQLQ